MKLANRAFVIALTMLTLVFAMSAQTLRTEKDDRNTAPTVGTGGSPGGPTGLFTIYDGQTLRAGEFTFSVAYSNFDRDPGDVDISEVPISFQVGLTDHLELFFNTDAYRSIKVNSPRNLSSFYLPNSNGGVSFPAIVAGSGIYANSAVFRPAGRQPFVPYPFVGGAGFPVFPVLGAPTGGGNGAALFPLIGSPYGSILPGVVLRTTTLANGQAPSSFTIAPSYLNDAPFINRTYAESSFNTFTVGAKWRWTAPNSAVGVGVIPFYRFYADKADDVSGFNQLQRGASPGSSRGDLGAIFFADARVRKWMNVSANAGYIWNGDIEADDITLLDRGDEVLAGVAVDFPVNKYFQPILEVRSQQFVGGRTPNAFENNPIDGLAGVRFFPTRWMGFGFAYRVHFNQQDKDSFDKDDSFTGSTTVLCPTVGAGCTPFTVQNSFRGVPPGFTPSNDPHGFIVQGWIGRRNKRRDVIFNKPANVTGVTVSAATVNLPCAPGTTSTSGACPDEVSVNVATTAVDPENDQLVYNYTVSGGRVVGSGANVTWDLSGVRPGSYTITAGVDDGCGICGETKTQTVEVKECPDCTAPCECPTISVTGPSSAVEPGQTMTFTANVSGGSQSDVTYNWTVSAGTIVEGQGTPTITVSTEGLSDTTITATVDIGGSLCEKCPTSDSETGVVASVPVAVPIDEFGPLANDDVKARLDSFASDLQANPDAQGYIINYGPAKLVTRREKLIRDYLTTNRGVSASRLIFVQGGAEPEIRTRLFRVPAGAQAPTP